MYLLLIIFLQIANAQLLAPQSGAYQGAYCDFGPMANEVTVERIKDFERLSQKKLVWAYFANDWLDGKIEFPINNVLACKEANVIPFIRMMPWTDSKAQATSKDPNFSMEQLIAGEHDEALRVYAQATKTFAAPIIFEFGPEVNGDWFPWNGRWNGGSKKTKYGDPNLPDGPERFRDAYRHIIDLFRQEQVTNATWVFHVDTAWYPRASWNEAVNYYPGDEYIDWIGLSVFGAQLPNHEWSIFQTKLSSFSDQLEKISTVKPVLIAEFGTIESNVSSAHKAAWINQALRSIEDGQFPRIKGISYWNSSGWLPEAKASFRIDSSPEAQSAYSQSLASEFWLTQGEFSAP